MSHVVDVPEHAPDHPVNFQYDDDGTAVSVMFAPAEILSEQSAPQLIPGPVIRPPNEVTAFTVNV
jgi:hypothetical protein